MGDRQEPASWDLDSDEIASITSEDLYNNRPNRWTGARSTWRSLTENERLLWRAMQKLQHQDLAVHLYNVFSLKKQALNPEMAQQLLVQTADGQDQVWTPPKSWTAWPLPEHIVPRQQLLTRQKDKYDVFTFRKEEERLPSAELQEEVAAIILRLAKARFNKRSKRKRKASMMAPIEPAPSSPFVSDDGPSLPSSPPGASGASETEDGKGTMADTESTNQRKKPDTFEPRVATDDDYSYKLLRPSARHILSKLDVTLTILHNTRVAGLSHLSDSSTDSDSDTQQAQRRSPSSSSASHHSSVPTNDDSASHSSASKRGRPRKTHTPCEGETEEEMRVRVARASHRRLPRTLPSAQVAAFEKWLHAGEQHPPTEAQGTVPDKTRARGEDTAARNAQRKLRCWGLRDWSDVVGAAALAGFPEAVIRRTTQRCANLFGEGMVLRHLEEAPLARADTFTTRTYLPQRIRLSSPSHDSQASSSSSSSEPPPLTQRRLSTASTPARSRSRSLSRCSSASVVFCPVARCERAVEGFSRRANLRRHMLHLHPGYGAEGEEEEGQEVCGAVRVDGFLRAIPPMVGWRGRDARPRASRGAGGVGEDVVMVMCRAAVVQDGVELESCASAIWSNSRIRTYIYE